MIDRVREEECVGVLYWGISARCAGKELGWGEVVGGVDRCGGWIGIVVTVFWDRA